MPGGDLAGFCQKKLQNGDLKISKLKS